MVFSGAEETAAAAAAKRAALGLRVAARVCWIGRKLKAGCRDCRFCRLNNRACACAFSRAKDCQV